MNWCLNSRLSLKNVALQCLTFGIVQQRGSRFCMFLLWTFADGWHHSIRFHCFAINCLKRRWQKFQPPLHRNRVLKFGKNTFCIYLGFHSPKKDGWPCSVSSFSMWKCEAVFLQAAADAVKTNIDIWHRLHLCKNFILVMQVEDKINLALGVVTWEVKVLTESCQSTLTLWKWKWKLRAKVLTLSCHRRH